MYFSVINILIQYINLLLLRNSFVRSSVCVCVCVCAFYPSTHTCPGPVSWWRGSYWWCQSYPRLAPAQTPMPASRRTIEPYLVSLFSNFTIKGLGSLCVFILWRMNFGGIQILMYSAEIIHIFIPLCLLRDASPGNTPPSRRSEWWSSLPPDCFVSGASIPPVNVS